MLFPSSLFYNSISSPLALAARRRRHHGIEKKGRHPPSLSLKSRVFISTYINSTTTTTTLLSLFFLSLPLLIFRSRGTPGCWRGTVHWRQISFDTFLFILDTPWRTYREKRSDPPFYSRVCCVSYSVHTERERELMLEAPDREIASLFFYFK